jgi:biotin carboxyl carrier protein
MLASGWNEVCVTGVEGDYFLARQPGTVNPLLAAETVSVAVDPVSVPFGSTEIIKAPHVGTVAWLAEIGHSVAEGGAVARLTVLDETIDIPSTKAGTIAAHVAQVNDLAEFSTPLVELAS